MNAFRMAIRLSLPWSAARFVPMEWEVWRRP
jgi:hypothetical protein